MNKRVAVETIQNLPELETRFPKLEVPNDFRNAFASPDVLAFVPNSDHGIIAAALVPRAIESRLFGRKMARIFLTPSHEKELIAVLVCHVSQVAKKNGYEHLMCRMNEESALTASAVFEQNGYSLMDLGMTFSGRAQSIEKAVRESASEAAHPGFEVRPMRETNLPQVLGFGATLFKHSHFFRDPFFGRSGGERLFSEWIKNSYEGQADIIWVAEREGDVLGFVACKVNSDKRGNISLVGVNPAYDGRGVGSAILKRSLKWFLENGAESVTVRTQAFNSPAINLYIKHGFRLLATDLMYVIAL